MKHLFLGGFLVIVSFLLTKSEAFGQNQVQAVNAVQFKQLLNQTPGVILDVRTPDEWNKGHVKGARLYNYMRNDFKLRVDSLDKNKVYYLYCASGGRSSDAAELLHNMGFKRVVTLTDAGFRDLKAAGLPTE